MAAGVPQPTSCTGWMRNNADLPESAYQTRALVGHATRMASLEHHRLTNHIGAATVVALAVIRAIGDFFQSTFMAIAECTVCIIGTNFGDARTAIATHGKDAFKSLFFIPIGTAMAAATIFFPETLRGLTLSRAEAVEVSPGVTDQSPPSVPAPTTSSPHGSPTGGYQINAAGQRVNASGRPANEHGIHLNQNHQLIDTYGSLLVDDGSGHVLQVNGDGRLTNAADQLVNIDGHRVNDAGHPIHDVHEYLVDNQGRRVNVNGYNINAAGQRVNAHDEPINAAGQLVNGYGRLTNAADPTCEYRWSSRQRRRSSNP